MLVGWLSKLARARAAMQRLIWEETHFARAWNWVTSQRRSVQRDDAWSFRKGWPGSPLRLWISPFWLVGLDLVDYSWLYLLCSTNQARVLWCANQVRHKARMTMTSFVHRLTCWLTGQAFSTSSSRLLLMSNPPSSALHTTKCTYIHTYYGHICTSTRHVIFLRWF